jgi:drug/metabolite transporter (DMT)-like permease
VVAAVIPYLAGIAAARTLGPKLSSFVGLVEVVFAVIVAWLLLGQMPTAMQLFGGALILAGIVLVQIDERPPSTALPDAADACVA